MSKKGQAQHEKLLKMKTFEHLKGSGEKGH